MALTRDTLVNSQAFKEWVGDNAIRLVHNPYEDGTPSFVVIHSDAEEMDKFTITRFWQSPNRKDQLDRIHVSVDYKNKTADEVFSLLLSEYSKGLD